MRMSYNHNNKKLEHFQLSDLKPARRGEQYIEVNFIINIKGIVNDKAQILIYMKNNQLILLMIMDLIFL